MLRTSFSLSFSLETGSHHAALASLELRRHRPSWPWTWQRFLLPLPLTIPLLVSVVMGTEPRALSVIGKHSYQPSHHRGTWFCFVCYRESCLQNLSVLPEVFFWNFYLRYLLFYLLGNRHRTPCPDIVCTFVLSPVLFPDNQFAQTTLFIISSWPWGTIVFKITLWQSVMSLASKWLIPFAPSDFLMIKNLLLCVDSGSITQLIPYANTAGSFEFPHRFSLLCLPFWDIISLCSPGWPSTLFCLSIF